MNSVNPTKNIKPQVNEVCYRYNFQHFVFVTKYRYKMFKNPKSLAIIRTALYDAAKNTK